jgi:hypothetical protein
MRWLRRHARSRREAKPERLFEIDVFSALEGVDGGIDMQVRGEANHDGIHLPQLEQVAVVGKGAGCRDPVFGFGPAPWVRLSEGDHFNSRQACQDAEMDEPRDPAIPHEPYPDRRHHGAGNFRVTHPT